MTKVALVGCGAISGIYLKNVTNLFNNLEFTGVCDLIPERAQKASEEYNIPKIYKNVEEVVADPQVDIVLNLTRPYEHFDVAACAIKAGKHVYSEKPLGATLEEGVELMRLAKEHNVLLGGAPDTFLGAGIQTCIQLIKDGYIGTPIGASAFLLCHGHETWHPDPEFYYKRGGGPMMDMGPYYVTALVSLLGPVAAVSGMTKTSFEKRMITSKPHYGEIIDVDVKTHIAGMMAFDSGVIGTIITSFDVYKAQMPFIEVYGSEGTLSVPNPNTFGGPIKLSTAQTKEFKEIPFLYNYNENSRGLGLADMADAIEKGQEYSANGDLNLHVLEIMTAFEESCKQRKQIDLKSTVKQPKQLSRNARY